MIFFQELHDFQNLSTSDEEDAKETLLLKKICTL